MLTFTERLPCFRPGSECFTALLLCKLDIVESDFAGGETEAQSIKCFAQVQMLLGSEFSPVGLLHETVFSPIVTACSLCPQVQSTRNLHDLEPRFKGSLTKRQCTATGQSREGSESSAFEGPADLFFREEIGGGQTS